MKPWTYPISAFVFNFILFNSFHWGEYGGALAVIITIPLIVVISLVLTFIHYRLDKKRQKTKYFQTAGIIGVILVSYFLFPTQNSPSSIIRKMTATARHYNEITINDYFLEYRYENYEKIVAAKKKFNKHLADTAYSVNISNFYDYKQLYKTYGINFFNNHPVPTDEKLKVDNVSKDTFRFTEYFMGDTISFSGSKWQIDVPKQRADSFSEFGTGHYRDTSLKKVEVTQNLKCQTPDENFWAYKIFYWLL